MQRSPHNLADGGERQCHNALVCYTGMNLDLNKFYNYISFQVCYQSQCHRLPDVDILSEQCDNPDLHNLRSLFIGYFMLFFLNLHYILLMFSSFLQASYTRGQPSIL